jgi:hypothetical protein
MGSIEKDAKLNSQEIHLLAKWHLNCSNIYRTKYKSAKRKEGQMKRFLAPVFVVFLLMWLILSGQQAKAATFQFNTSDSEFDTGVKNQGFYSPGISNVTTNENYITGTAISGGQQFYRSFFTFDLSSLVGYTVTSATLQLTTFGVTADAATETLGFYDVSTDAATLNNNTGTNSTIYNDLGSGKSYGQFTLTIAGLPSVLSFNLNSDAVTDINAASGGWFSVGGAHLSISSSGSEHFFGGYSSENGGGVQRLILEATPNGVPEPANMLLFGSGLVGLWGFRKRIRK